MKFTEEKLEQAFTELLGRGRGTLKIYNSCKEHGLPVPDIIEKDGGFMVVLYKTSQDTVEVGAIGGQVEIYLAEFGTRASRKKVDRKINKEILKENFGLFSEYFQNNFRKASGKLQEKFAITSGKLQKSLYQIGF